ncbi:MAG TPA: hypothetical protein VIN60_07445 [Anaerolineales bacterium]
MWKNTILVVALTLFVGLLFILTISNCNTPVIPDTRSGQVYVTCDFPYPWAWLFGGGLQSYEFNFYLCLAIPTIIIIVVYLRSSVKHGGE